VNISRRGFLKTVGLGIGAAALGAEALAAGKESELAIRPTPQQLAWQEAELAMFFHFGTNTFTDREWGEGDEDPRVFNPTRLDTRQWVQVAKDAGFKYLILTAKHHDGMCMWPSKYTEHTVKNSAWKQGKGDVVSEFAKAVHDAGLKLGFYLSPWDRNSPCYGDSPAYNQYFRNQLTELLTNYGEVAEVWFDGACGEGPNGKKQEYDWQSFYEVIRRLQPNALIAISGPDVRWVGNESGFAQETEWCMQPANPTFHPGLEEVWWPAETDVSIRPGWFWHKHEDEKVKSLEKLVDIYFTSVGRNSVLLLNVPPNSEGLIAHPDVKRLREWRSYLDRAFKTDLVKGKCRLPWSPEAVPATLELDLGEPVEFSVAMMQEQIAVGQFVEAYRVEAMVGDEWRELSKGTTIGHKKLDRFDRVRASRIRLRIEKSRGRPHISRFGLFNAPELAAT
jgi:alpha-L-fucosidase